MFLMKKINIPVLVFAGALLAAGFAGFVASRSFDPMTVALRKAQELSRRGIEQKKEAVAILTSQKELNDYAFKYAQNSQELQIIALSLANILIKYEHYPDALKYLEIAKSIKPADYGVQFHLGLVYFNLLSAEKSPALRQDYRTKALRHLETANGLLPENVDARYLLGLIHYQDRVFSEALPLFLGILQSHPDEPNTLFAVGRLYYDSGELEKAQKIYLKLQTILPKDDPKHMIVSRNLRIISESLAK